MRGTMEQARVKERASERERGEGAKMASRVLSCSALFVFFVAALFLSSIVQISVADDGDGDGAVQKEFVLTLDHTNFTETVSKHDFIVVEFYAPWCGHCKNLAPEYEKAASILNGLDLPIALAKVDADEELNKELAAKFKVQGYPSIKILRKGGLNSQEYNGPREAEGIVNYLKKQAGPASAEIKTAEDASNLIDAKKIVIVGIFPKFLGEAYENFTAIAENLRGDYDFVHTLDAKHIPRGESSVKGPVIRLLKPFDELVVDIQDFNADTVEKFVEENSVPTVCVFNQDEDNRPFLTKFFNNPNAKAMLFFNFSCAVADAFKSKYHEVAVLNKGKGISFLIGDLEPSQDALQYFGLKQDQAPLVIIQNDDGKKFLKANVEPDQIAPWLNEYLDGSIKPFIKSQPIPEVNDEPVKVVVAESLQDVFFNSGKNVLLEFYAPWCGHCKQLAPILHEVAVSFESDPDVIIAKMDATENDVGDDTLDVKGFPTLYFRSASGKVLQYEEDRTKEAIIGFINSNRDKVIETIKTDTTSETIKTDASKDEL